MLLLKPDPNQRVPRLGENKKYLLHRPAIGQADRHKGYRYYFFLVPVWQKLRS
jgi:hypothetical protein